MDGLIRLIQATGPRVYFAEGGQELVLRDVNAYPPSSRGRKGAKLLTGEGIPPPQWHKDTWVQSGGKWHRQDPSHLGMLLSSAAVSQHKAMENWPGTHECLAVSFESSCTPRPHGVFQV